MHPIHALTILSAGTQALCPLSARRLDFAGMDAPATTLDGQIEVAQVAKTYRDWRRRRACAAADRSDDPAREFVVLLGPSGCGKRPCCA